MHKQSGNKNIKFKKTGYQKWSHGDWEISAVGGYMVSNKVENVLGFLGSLKEARDFVTCRILGIDWFPVGSKEWLEKLHKTEALLLKENK